jgi:hypothetical protein
MVVHFEVTGETIGGAVLRARTGVMGKGVGKGVGKGSVLAY